MTDQEVDEIIADFMGYKLMHTSLGNHWKLPEGGVTNTRFTESLDALVPVWDKMGNKMLHFGSGFDEQGNLYNCFQLRPAELDESVSSVKPTIFLAAAHATAKCIKEIDNE